MSEQPWDAALREFAAASRFREGGGIVTDLDGTAVHEHEGRVAIPHSVSHALTRLSGQGHPIVINTLRFPMSVIGTFGQEWYAITSAPLPLISLNGSMIGHLAESSTGAIVFEEVEARVLAPGEVEEVLTGVEGLIRSGVDRLLVFYYPRDWRLGERIWTPVAARMVHVRHKYLSASEVFWGDVDRLRSRLAECEVCMVFLLVEQPTDELMAYQHVKPSSFITSAGVDKQDGMRRLAARLGVDPAEWLGAGDTPMDTFLSDVGLAVHVGRFDLEFRGRWQTVKIRDSLELGVLLRELSALGETTAAE
ncbi:MAG: HAD hydrolase family protein [Hyphomicrobiaceae bacterium]|nr:HAD hydrolase family protein [Hyphomicrobiaceae bacterium]